MDCILAKGQNAISVLPYAAMSTLPYAVQFAVCWGQRGNFTSVRTLPGNIGNLFLWPACSVECDVF